MLFSERKCEIEVSRKEYWAYSESYFLNCFVSPWGPTQLCQIVPNHEYASYRGKKWIYLYLGGINILVESRYLAQINTLPFYFHLKPPILICVVRVIHCRYILIQNTFITEASYKKFFFYYSFVAFNFQQCWHCRDILRGIMPEYVRKRIICLLSTLAF